MARLVRSAILPLAALLVAGAPASRRPGERLVVRPDSAAPSFEPGAALGAAIDGTERGGVDRILTPHNVAAMRGAGSSGWWCPSPCHC